MIGSVLTFTAIMLAHKISFKEITNSHSPNHKASFHSTHGPYNLPSLSTNNASSYLYQLHFLPSLSYSKVQIP